MGYRLIVTERAEELLLRWTELSEELERSEADEG